MTKLFISFKFDDDLSRTIATQVKDELKRYGVQAVIAGDLMPAPPPEAIRSLILASDGLLWQATNQCNQNLRSCAMARSYPYVTIAVTLKLNYQLGASHLNLHLTEYFN